MTRYKPPEKEERPEDSSDTYTTHQCDYCMGTGYITTGLGYIKTCYRCEGTGIDPDGT